MPWQATFALSAVRGWPTRAGPGLVAAFRLGGLPRCTMISAESAESRPSRCAVAFASPGTADTAKGGQLREGRA